MSSLPPLSRLPAVFSRLGPHAPLRPSSPARYYPSGRVDAPRGSTTLCRAGLADPFTSSSREPASLVRLGGQACRPPRSAFDSTPMKASAGHSHVEPFSAVLPKQNLRVGSQASAPSCSEVHTGFLGLKNYSLASHAALSPNTRHVRVLLVRECRSVTVGAVQSLPSMARVRHCGLLVKWSPAQRREGPPVARRTRGTHPGIEGEDGTGDGIEPPKKGGPFSPPACHSGFSAGPNIP